MMATAAAAAAATVTNTRMGHYSSMIDIIRRRRMVLSLLSLSIYSSFLSLISIICIDPGISSIVVDGFAPSTLTTTRTRAATTRASTILSAASTTSSDTTTTTNSNNNAATSSSSQQKMKNQTPEQKARRKELLKRDGSYFRLDRSNGRVEFGSSAKLVTTLLSTDEDDESESIKQWLSDGDGIAKSIWDPELLTDLGNNVYQLRTMPLQFVTMKLSPSVDVQMWTQKGQNIKTGDYIPVFNIQSVRYDPNLQFMPGMPSVTAESLGIVIEVVGELIPSKDGKGVTGKISFATSGDLPPPLLILPDQALQVASDTINDAIVSFAIDSFQSGARRQYNQFRQQQQQQQQ